MRGSGVGLALLSPVYLKNEVRQVALSLLVRGAGSKKSLVDPYHRLVQGGLI